MKRVVIIGAGKAAIDSARCVLSHSSATGRCCLAAVAVDSNITSGFSDISGKIDNYQN